MRTARALLVDLHEKTPRERSAVFHGGVVIKRVLLRSCARYYEQAMTRYLNGRVLERIEAAALATSWADVQNGLRSDGALGDPFAWTDVGGLLMPTERLRALEGDLVSGSLDSLEAVLERLSGIAAMYREDEWEFVCAAFASDRGFAPHEMTPAQAADVTGAWQAAADSLLRKTLDDSRSEFGPSARIGYGLGMTGDEREADFAAVRGSAETNAVVQKLARELAGLAERAERMKGLLARF
jgi:hypothetical protein